MIVDNRDGPIQGQPQTEGGEPPMEWRYLYLYTNTIPDLFSQNSNVLNKHRTHNTNIFHIILAYPCLLIANMRW